MRRATVIFLIFSLFLIIYIPCVNGISLDIHEGTMKGRVYVSDASKSGIPNLTVRLTPSKGMKTPEKITTTDDKGNFLFKDLDKGRYLLEVYQGVTLLYRDVVDTSQDMKREISLKRKK